MDMGFDVMFTIVPIIIFFGFIFIFGSIIYNAISVAKDKTKPIIPVKAKLVAKRTHVRGDHSHTQYYATFELENGERIEFLIPDHKVGYLTEGDIGILHFQGNLFVEFKRTEKNED
ncbi:MAG: DUF2500 domain-containing protein [Epulopiscium sp.]|mgnify:CR=1 FL=1|nr:DUF2500 domain-containing protein [Candidatus Epulonipiscium sp.]